MFTCNLKSVKGQLITKWRHKADARCSNQIETDNNSNNQLFSGHSVSFANDYVDLQNIKGGP